MQELDDIRVGIRTDMLALEETPAWTVRKYGIPLYWSIVLRDDYLAHGFRQYLNALKDFASRGEKISPERLRCGPLKWIGDAMRFCLPELRRGNWIATGLCKETLNERREIRPEIWAELDPEKPSLDWLSDRVELNGIDYRFIRIRPTGPIPFETAVLALSAKIEDAERVIKARYFSTEASADVVLLRPANELASDIYAGRYKTHAWEAADATLPMPDRGLRAVGAEEWKVAAEIEKQWGSLGKINHDHVTFQDGRVLDRVVVILPAPLQ